MTPRLPKPPRVAVVIEASNAYARGLLAGIHRHLREHEPWTVFLPEHGRGSPPLEQLAGWLPSILPSETFATMALSAIRGFAGARTAAGHSRPP